ncbi:MAG: hypothetical protein ABIP21_04720 [Acidimicrobiia bacterium]
MWRDQRRRANELAALQAETTRLQVDTLRTELGDLHHAMARRDVELLSALTQVAAVNERLRLQLATDHTQQTRLVRSIDRLAMFLAAPVIAATAPASGVVPSADQGAGTILGGSVDPAHAPDTTIDLTDELMAELPVAPATRREQPLACEVHLQFGDRWIDGFQIEETIHTGELTQFRLRRQVDGWVLPELFDESEVRVFMQPVVDTTR